MSRSIPLPRLFLLAMMVAVLATASVVRSGGAQFDERAGVLSNALAPNVPTLVFPISAVPIHRIIYIWTAVSGATKYQVQVYRGATLILNRGLASTVCVSGTCSFRHNVDLPNASYTWRVRAMVGGVWQAFSTWRAFSVALPIQAFTLHSQATPWIGWYIKGFGHWRDPITSRPRAWHPKPPRSATPIITPR